MTQAIAGLEMGGTKCVLTLAEGPDATLASQRIPTTDPATTLAAIEAVLDEWQGRFAALGIGAFGPLDLDPDSATHGSIIATPKPGWSGTDVLQRLKARYGVPMAMQTDVTGAAFAEGRWGAAQGLHDHAYITIGTGVGVGVIVDGKPAQGALHGEAGHMRLPRVAGDSWPGFCPFHGDCGEGLFAGPALAARFGRPGADLSNEDPCWDLVLRDIAAMLHNLVVTLAPQRIAIGGGVLSGREALFPRLRGYLAESLAGYGAFGSYADQLDRRLGPPGLGDRAGPLGAIALAMDLLDR